MTRLIGGKTQAGWLRAHPVLRQVMAREEVCWLNPAYGAPARQELFDPAEIDAAEARLRRFAPYLSAAFPETQAAGGVIESPLFETATLQEQLALPGRLLMKADNLLPISGSIKARGGIYEVLKTAETLACQAELLDTGDDYARLADESFRRFFSAYSLAIGSTGNLGLSIGIVGARLGFRTTVHMSRDAQQWKKDLLREKGAIVREYAADYSVAVAEGRRAAAGDPHCHFVDDESSADLFAGYAVAARRLQAQLDAAGIVVDCAHPLFVYLPCGVGGGPGGVAFGLKQIFGEAVHPFFVEPVAAPCFLLGLLTGLNERVSVADFGLDNRTAADGLAVARPSAFVGRVAGPLVAGCLTVTDAQLFRALKTIADTTNQQVEPSAAAGLAGVQQFLRSTEGRAFIEAHGSVTKMDHATHLFWATGGGMVPEQIRTAYYQQAVRIDASES